MILLLIPVLMLKILILIPVILLLITANTSAATIAVDITNICTIAADTANTNTGTIAVGTKRTVLIHESLCNVRAVASLRV